MNLGRTASSRALIRRQAQGLDKSSRAKFFEEVRENKKRKDLLEASSIQGASFAAAQTAMEDPQANGVNLIIESFPESEEYLKRLSIDPDDILTSIHK